MGKYRKKPVVIEAFKWLGSAEQKEEPERHIVTGTQPAIVTGKLS